MTDRHTAYLVTLDEPIREDDAEDSILVALRQIKGIARIKPVTSEPFTEQAAADRRDRAWTEALRALAAQGPKDIREGS